jgi:hypothetical protein
MQEVSHFYREGLTCSKHGKNKGGIEKESWRISSSLRQETKDFAL